MDDEPARIACPTCGATETLSDLSRAAQALLRRLGKAVTAVDVPRQDACVACGTLYDPWVRREATRRRLEVERLRREVARGT